MFKMRWGAFLRKGQLQVKRDVNKRLVSSIRIGEFSNENRGLPDFLCEKESFISAELKVYSGN